MNPTDPYAGTPTRDLVRDAVEVLINGDLVLGYADFDIHAAGMLQLFLDLAETDRINLEDLTPVRSFAIAVLHPSPDEHTCRVCGCTDDDACDPPCSWFEPTLCTGCAPNVISNLLALVADEYPVKAPAPHVVMQWPLNTQRAACDWAAATHLAAADNDVHIPPMPDVLFYGPHRTTNAPENTHAH